MNVDLSSFTLFTSVDPRHHVIRITAVNLARNMVRILGINGRYSFFRHYFLLTHGHLDS